MTPILETERMVFHPFTPDDFALLAELHADPQVQRYLGGLWDRAVIQARLDYYVGQQARLGFSKWKAYLRDGTFVGRAGVSVMRDSGELELGYSFARPAWGRGLASEAAQGVVEWMWRKTDVQELIGFAMVEHGASRRILEKLGMTFERIGEWAGERCAFYRLQRP